MAYWIYKLYFGKDGAGGNSWKEKTLFLQIQQRFGKEESRQSREEKFSTHLEGEWEEKKKTAGRDQRELEATSRLVSFGEEHFQDIERMVLG